MSSPRKATVLRKTSETDVRVELNLDGTGDASVATGLGFLDHMLTAFARHAGFDLSLTCMGDLNVDDHHSAEDCALCLGQAIDEALGDKNGIARFGFAYAPMDEALARVVVDLSGRAFAVVNIPFERDQIGTVATENLAHVLVSLAHAGRFNLHADLLRGENDHHKAEAVFKALALSMRQAVARTQQGIPSTKGVI
jgi:imidazoleglycerol phosphate dehydratase HisB